MCARVCASMCVSSPSEQHEEDVLLSAQILHCGCPGPDLTPEDVVEDLSHVFLTLAVGHETCVTMQK